MFFLPHTKLKDNTFVHDVQAHMASAGDDTSQFDEAAVLQAVGVSCASGRTVAMKLCHALWGPALPSESQVTPARSLGTTRSPAQRSMVKHTGKRAVYCSSVERNPLQTSSQL